VSGVVAALAAAVLLGTACGLIGTFVVVRRMALTGDMLSHAVLPGIVMGLALCSTRHPHLVLLCAVVAGVLGSLAMSAILRHTRLKPDAALSIVLSVFFALGIALISRLQPAGVQAFLYGQIAAIDRGDLVLLCAVCALTLLVVPLLFRVLCLSSFDAAFARLLGVRVRGIELIFFLLLSVVIVVAMQAVGVVLVTALLVTPAAAARFCTISLWKMAAIACVTGAAGGVLGVAISARWGGLPTGPLMALSVTGLFVLAFGFGPRSGLWPVWHRRRREAVRIAGEDVLKKLWLVGQPPGAADGIPQRELYPRLPAHGRAALRRLEADALVCRDHMTLRLTPAGCERATELVRAHRLWECYLTDLGGFKADHVHGPAERAEHWLDEQGRRELAEKLGNPQVDPHHSPIPGEGRMSPTERSD
jgi:manganese/zinc/iron transport system permease protein